MILDFFDQGKLKGEKERVYVALDAALFMAGVTVLMEAKADDAAIKKPKKASKAEVSPLETKSACQASAVDTGRRSRSEDVSGNQPAPAVNSPG